MDLGLNDRVVFVTGASSGIGRASAVAFGAEGAKVALTYAGNDEAAEETAAAVRAAGGETLVVPLLLQDPASIGAAVDAVRDAWGGIDVLVANAVEWGERPPPGTTFDGAEPEIWQRHLR